MPTFEDNEIDIDPRYKVDVKRHHEELELEALRDELATQASSQKTAHTPSTHKHSNAFK